MQLDKPAIDLVHDLWLEGIWALRRQLFHLDRQIIALFLQLEVRGVVEFEFVANLTYFLDAWLDKLFHCLLHFEVLEEELVVILHLCWVTEQSAMGELNELFLQEFHFLLERDDLVAMRLQCVLLFVVLAVSAHFFNHFFFVSRHLLIVQIHSSATAKGHFRILFFVVILSFNWIFTEVELEFSHCGCLLSERHVLKQIYRLLGFWNFILKSCESFGQFFIKWIRVSWTHHSLIRHIEIK